MPRKRPVFRRCYKDLFAVPSPPPQPNEVGTAAGEIERVREREGHRKCCNGGVASRVVILGFVKAPFLDEGSLLLFAFVESWRWDGERGIDALDGSVRCLPRSVSRFRECRARKNVE
ncbi:hypothetical protein GW17_00020231 [Ensete ventricosum]|nr:hypothetical protein GW17_00020231 [Ensete ventricosum]RZS03175.1 hypothetical protein BHM03_00033315 [Ensete ventricosum]